MLPDRSGRLDLRVRALDGDGDPVAILYAEHKEPGARFQDDQPRKYLAALRREVTLSQAEGRFLVVVGASDDMNRGALPRRRPRVRREVARAADEARRVDTECQGLVVGKTWQDIANAAELAGRDAHGKDPLDWRDGAAQSDAPASQRVLCELLWYLEEEGYAVTNGLTPEQLELATQALEIEDTLGELVEASTALIGDSSSSGGESGVRGGWVVDLTGAGLWPAIVAR